MLMLRRRTPSDIGVDVTLEGRVTAPQQRVVGVGAYVLVVGRERDELRGAGKVLVRRV